MKFEEKAINYLQFNHCISMLGNDSITVVMSQHKSRSSDFLSKKIFWLGLSYDKDGSIESQHINFIRDVTITDACISGYYLIEFLSRLPFSSIGKLGIRFEAASDSMMDTMKNYFIKTLGYIENDKKV
ncbi:MAG: hypothetical protein Q4F95_06770 [Oscillospiraceae bacterium]|nr:hypothetical protein [Oscillospiraceae bacterium]